MGPVLLDPFRVLFTQRVVDLTLKLNVRARFFRKRVHFHIRPSVRIPRKRCCPLSPAKHRKILRPLRGGAAQGCLGFDHTKLSEMKTKQFQSNFKRTLSRIFRRSSRRHDPMLVLNMALFNFTDGWNRAFSRDQYARFSV